MRNRGGAYSLTDMLLCRIDETSVLAISQPHHAWVSGELARAWGNAAFAVPEPRDAVICGAAIHDIGWLDWEAAPRLDEKTGLPMTFPGLRAQEHAPMWRRGVELAAAYGAIPALLVSRHGVSIYERFFDPAKAPADAVAAVEDFLGWQREFEAASVARLACDPVTAAAVGVKNLAFTKRFVATLDAMSLHLCWGRSATIEGTPRSPDTTVSLALRREGRVVVVDPWPFAAEVVEIVIEGRRLAGTFDGQAALDIALRDAPIVRIAVELRPG